MFKELKKRIRQRFVAEYSGMFAREKIDEKSLSEAITKILKDMGSRENLRISEQDKKILLAELKDEVMGLGPIESLLNDPKVTEIMIVGPKKVYVERNGLTKRLENITFDDENQLMYFVYKILSPTRRHVDEVFPYTEIALKNGARVNIVIAPVALDGPVITIRKFLDEIKTIEDLVKLGTMDTRIADFLVAAVNAKLNIVFCGATGAGKTTTLNVLTAYIPLDERIVTIEDTAELRLKQDHVVRLEARQTNIEGKGEITISDLFKNSLRMRPDRIIIGEIRGSEALDMLQAICSGHSGSLSVIHANSPQDVIYRLETMILTSGIPISLEAIHRQIAAGLQLIVHQKQFMDGSRKVTNVSQINGLRNGQVVLQDIFSYSAEDFDPQSKVTGKWLASGITPAAMSLFRKAGIKVPEEMFRSDV